MPGIENKFAQIAPRLKEVKARVDRILTDYCQKHEWLFASRTKKLASTIEKMQTGRYKTLAELDDLLAFSVIVDVRSQQREVISFIKKVFDVKSVKGKSTLNDERVFDFDATRIYACLQLHENSPLSEIVFEIQVRTILQHAWSKITHPLVYKAEHIDARKIRLAAEALASIELIDRNLSTFTTVSRAVKIVKRNRSVQLNTIIKMIDQLIRDNIIPRTSRPANGRRFAESILSAMHTRNKTFDEVLAVIRQFYVNESKNFPVSVSLYELAIVALYRSDTLSSGSKSRPRYHYVTTELISLYPDVKQIRPMIIM